MAGEVETPALTVEFSNPDYLMLLIEDGEIAGTLTFINEEGDDEHALGMIAFIGGDEGAPMVCVREVLDPEHVLIGTSLGNVKRIVVL